MRIRNLALNTRQQPRYAHYSQSHNSTTDCIFLWNASKKTCNNRDAS
jgi:hypothetical protein